MKGVVLRSTGSFYDVLTEDGSTIVCRVRGRIRLEGIKESNPVAVGDQVEFDLEHDVGAITAILPRRNHMLRRAVKRSGHAHVLAANIDQACLIATVAYPRTSTGFIDRFLVSAEAFRIPQTIVFNKVDLLNDEERTLQDALMDIYQGIGINVMAMSALTDDIGALHALLKGKTTLLAGHSGVGKSTLLNRIDPSINQKVAEISDFSLKGRHTTTFAEMFNIGDNSFVIDTPGVKEWGLFDMTEQELSDYFPEMRERRLDCRFGARCLHVNEPGCAIIPAVEAGDISPSRYDSYLSMLQDEDSRK